MQFAAAKATKAAKAATARSTSDAARGWRSADGLATFATQRADEVGERGRVEGGQLQLLAHVILAAWAQGVLVNTCIYIYHVIHRSVHRCGRNSDDQE